MFIFEPAHSFAPSNQSLRDFRVQQMLIVMTRASKQLNKSLIVYNNKIYKCK